MGLSRSKKVACFDGAPLQAREAADSCPSAHRDHLRSSGHSCRSSGINKIYELRQVRPKIAEELKEDRGGRLNVMPTSFNENTRVSAELSLPGLLAAWLRGLT